MRIKVLAISLGVFILALIGICWSYGWFIGKQARVVNGTARPTFPYSDYSAEELNKMYPQTANENVATTQSPEETYMKLKQALEHNDVELALAQFYSTNKELYRKIFEEEKANGNLTSLADKMEDTIIRDDKNSTDLRCTYLMDKSKKEIEFVKSTRGVWLIRSL